MLATRCKMAWRKIVPTEKTAQGIRKTSEKQCVKENKRKWKGSLKSRMQIASYSTSNIYQIKRLIRGGIPFCPPLLVRGFCWTMSCALSAVRRSLLVNTGELKRGSEPERKVPLQPKISSLAVIGEGSLEQKVCFVSRLTPPICVSHPKIFQWCLFPR